MSVVPSKCSACDQMYKHRKPVDDPANYEINCYNH